MEQEIQRAFEDLFDLFIQDGWKHFKGDWEGTRKNIEHKILNNELTEAQYNFEKGQLNVLNNMMNYENTVRANYDNLTVNSEQNEG